MASARVKLGSNGRLVIPASLRREIGIESGDTLILESKGRALSVRSIDDAVRNAQDLVARYVGNDVSLSEELIEDRRREARDEAGGVSEVERDEEAQSNDAANG